MGSEVETYSFERGTFSVPERGEIRIEDCPARIGTLLERASFDEVSTDVYVKTQSALQDDDDTEYRVVTVRLDHPVMHVSVRDNVGIVSLTPQSKLRIEPKIDWKHLFDMLLAVHGRKRSTEYRGIPVTELQSEDIDLEDLFLILAVNYLNGLERIHRKGFIREIETRRADLDQPRGIIDIEQSLLNQAEGRAQQHCLLKEVNYDNSANSLLHYAGIHLLRLFRQYSEKYDNPAYSQIFSQVHEEVRHLDDLDVGSSRRRMDEYQRFSLDDLPTQRRYYKQAIDVSRSIVMSSLGTPAMTSDRELVVDYVLNMETLFEEYSQVAIEQELQSISQYDHVDVLENVSAVESPHIKPFEDVGQVYHEPDHALEEGDDTLAVLDSKYYAEDKDPVRHSDLRSQLFAYTYLLGTEQMAFVMPLAAPQRRMVQQTEGELQVVSPETANFDLDSYHRAIREYLHDVLACRYGILEAFRAVKQHHLCLDQYDASALHRVLEPGGPFDFSNVEEFSLRVINAAADTLSVQYGTREDLEQDGEWTRTQIETKCRDNRDAVCCIPVFRSGGQSESVELYFIYSDSSNTPSEVVREGGLKLL
jgi:5-methylcytosine-specific restriction endonuclease McrBC regulatory subunit McrC